MTFRFRFRATDTVLALVATLALLPLGSCEGPAPSSAPRGERLGDSLPTNEELVARIDDALQWTRTRRSLSLETHAAWQILHGVLAYGRRFEAERADGTSVRVVDYLLGGGTLRGWDAEMTTVGDPPRPSARLLLAPGSKAGQGHADQWLAVLAQCNLRPDQPVRFGDTTVRFQDLIDQMLEDVHRNVDREYSWTLIAATRYYDTTHRWIAGDGKSWSIERLLEIELEQELATSTCGGTHRLIGMAMALDRRRAEHRSLSGVWQRAQQVIDEAAERAREFQHADGSFSTDYFERPAYHSDLKEHLGATGHTLEFLAISQSDDVLAEAWVRRAATRLTRLFELTRNVPLECGALYHAAHGLALYRNRIAEADVPPEQ